MRVTAPYFGPISSALKCSCTCARVVCSFWALAFAMSDRHFLYEIHTAFYRHGIGRALMQRVQSSAHEWMQVHVHTANVKAQRFYLAMGFCRLIYDTVLIIIYTHIYSMRCYLYAYTAIRTPIVSRPYLGFTYRSVPRAQRCAQGTLCPTPSPHACTYIVSLCS